MLEGMHTHTHTPFSVRNSANPRYALLAGGWAVGTVSILIVAKLYAYVQSGSSAVLATLMDSLVDGGISVMMLLAVRMSLKPADENHRHGHGKIEGLAALFQSAAMFAGAAFLAFESAHRFMDPDPLRDHMLGIGVAGLAIVLSLVLIGVQKFCLVRAPSLAIEADSVHYKTDAALNGSVIAVLLLDYYGAPEWIDPASGLLIAAYFLLTAAYIGRKGMDMLMDRELPPEVRGHIEAIISRHTKVLGMHDLRTRKSGMTLYISFDIELDPDMSLQAAHDIARTLETAILRDFPYAEIMIHMDPVGDTADARHTL